MLIGLSNENNTSNMQKKVIITRSIISWLSANVESTNGSQHNVKLATSLINLLLLEMDGLEQDYLEEIALGIVKCIQENIPIQPRSFEILSKTVNLLATMAELHIIDNIINHICKATWHPQSTVGLISSINEMELTNAQLNAVSSKILILLKELDIEEVPPFVYQLLLLSRKGNKRDIIKGICNYFDWLQQEEKNNDKFRDEIGKNRMEGTVMLHISFSIKQDQDLGTELLKYMKNEKLFLTENFHMACLLSVARIHRLEEPIFDLFKTTITTVYKDSDKLKKSSWISRYSNINANLIHQRFMDIVEKSALGWDQVIQSLVQLGLVLIDNGANLGNFLRSQFSNSRTKGLKQGPLENVIGLGIDLLLKMFKLHEIIRSEILEQITSRIITRSNSSIDFLHLLERLITDCPNELEKHLNNVKDTLEYLSLLSFPTAKQLLTAVKPITIDNIRFRDSLILVLRKSMFTRELDGRMISVFGFLDILHTQLESVKNSLNSTKKMAAEGVAYEILGLLRRCFSQQYEIREIAYNGLGYISLKFDTLINDIFEILNTQFLRIYEANDGIATPLKLDVCVEQGSQTKLIEPIHILLMNLLSVIRVLKNKQYETDTFTLSHEHIKSLTVRLIKLDLEDYELDKFANFDTTTPVGLRHYYNSEMIIGCIDALMEHEFFVNGDSMESCQIILGLFKKRTQLLGLLKENSNKDKGRKFNTLSTFSMVSLEFITDVSQAVFLQSDIQSPLKTLRSDLNFMFHIASASLSSLTKAIDDENSRDKDDIHFNYCISLAKVYTYILIHEDSDSSFINHQPKKGQSILSSIANRLKSILEIIHNVWENRSTKFLSQLYAMINPDTEGLSRNNIISDLLKQFKDILIKYLNANTPLYKEAIYIIQITGLLVQFMDQSEDDFKDTSSNILKWLVNIAKDRPIEDIGLAKEIVSLLLQFFTDTNQLNIIQEFAEDIHLIHGDIDTELEEDENVVTKYQLINDKTHETVTLQVLSHAEQAQDNLMWSIGRLQYVSSDDDVSRQEFELALCNRLCCYVDITSELTKAALLGVHAEYLIKVLTKKYKALTTFVKYKLTTPKYISKEFIQLISKIGSELTDKMYKFLTLHAQNRQADYEEAGGAGKKKGKKKEINAKEKAKILRESRSIPNLIFCVEQFERHLIQLTRKSKTDLMQYMKRSTSRDFQIKLDKYVASEEEDSDNEKRSRQNSTNSNNEEAMDLISDEDDGENEQSSKRRRL
ncbi:unnamed protein product [Cunninghamella blakesleeana]